MLCGDFNTKETGLSANAGEELDGISDVEDATASTGKVLERSNADVDAVEASAGDVSEQKNAAIDVLDAAASAGYSVSIQPSVSDPSANKAAGLAHHRSSILLRAQDRRLRSPPWYIYFKSTYLIIIILPIMHGTEEGKQFQSCKQ